MPAYSNGESVEVQTPPRQTGANKAKKALGPVAALGVLVAKFFAQLKFFLLPALKFLPLLLKSGGTMLLTIWIYTQMWGWKFAVGFVLLLFVHECGHLVVARKFGLKVGAPVFIPFMGAFIALKEAPRNAERVILKQAMPLDDLRQEIRGLLASRGAQPANQGPDR